MNITHLAIGSLFEIDGKIYQLIRDDSGCNIADEDGRRLSQAFYPEYHEKGDFVSVEYIKEVFNKYGRK
ncbi:MAG: hypothetical protein PHC28_04920 [Flavobacterium sp.]|uniref:hypothetical protein n=1 Tax=Flavobacterium sp. TaxID=239 RepID=UPI002623AA90|nr:hypothetical protein [Flavobacterium sp.]MDD5149808.1 hypothetical protein [Flavobacterium sp.]